MSQHRNWNALAGSVLGLGAVVVYFLLVLTTDPRLQRWLEWPLPNLIAIGTGLALSLIGVRQALRRTHRGRVLAPILAALNLGLAGLFGWYLFVYSYRMPPAQQAPAAGSVAPDFALQDERGSEVRLSSLRGQPVVLVFYRGYWCPYCMGELQGLQRRAEEFKGLGAVVLAVVVDPVERNAEVVKGLGLTYRILADPELRVIDAYDLRHDDGGQTGTIARSATFVIDRDGVVRWRDLTESYRHRPQAEDVLAQVASLGRAR